MSAKQNKIVIVDFKQIIDFIWNKPDDKMASSFAAFFVAFGGIQRQYGMIEFFDNTVEQLIEYGFAEYEK